MPSSTPPGGSTPPSQPSQPSEPSQPGPAGASSGPSLPTQVPPSSGGGKPMTFLGMTFSAEQAKQLNNIMIQNVANQIQDYNDKGVKAIKNFEKVSEGEEPDL